MTTVMIRSKKEDIILIGGGGHCRSCIDVIEMCCAPLNLWTGS
jgi:hypothetical protein